MKIITNHPHTIEQGKIIAKAEARIRDGHFHFYLYMEKHEDNIVPLHTLRSIGFKDAYVVKPYHHITDQSPALMMRFLLHAKLYWDRGEDKTEIDTSMLLTPQGFTGLFFHEYVRGCMDPDYEAWWEGYVIEM